MFNKRKADYVYHRWNDEMNKWIKLELRNVTRLIKRIKFINQNGEIIRNVFSPFYNVFFAISQCYQNYTSIRYNFKSSNSK